MCSPSECILIELMNQIPQNGEKFVRKFEDANLPTTKKSILSMNFTTKFYQIQNSYIHVYLRCAVVLTCQITIKF